MQEDKPRTPLSGSDILAMVMLFLIVFGVGLLLMPVYSEYIPACLFSKKGVLAVLVFNAIWLVAMKLWSSKAFLYRAYLSILVISLSSVVLVCWVATNALRNAW